MSSTKPSAPPFGAVAAAGAAAGAAAAATPRPPRPPRRRARPPAPPRHRGHRGRHARRAHPDPRRKRKGRRPARRRARRPAPQPVRRRRRWRGRRRLWRRSRRLWRRWRRRSEHPTHHRHWVEARRVVADRSRGRQPKRVSTAVEHFHRTGARERARVAAHGGGGVLQRAARARPLRAAVGRRCRPGVCRRHRRRRGSLRRRRRRRRGAFPAAVDGEKGCADGRKPVTRGSANEVTPTERIRAARISSSVTDALAAGRAFGGGGTRASAV